MPTMLSKPSLQPAGVGPPGRLAAADAAVMFFLAAAVVAFHLLAGRGLANSVLLQSFNWVFDFDSSRFVGALCTPGADVAADVDLSFIARHGLVLAGRPLCLALEGATLAPPQALMLLTALCAGLNAALAYALAAACCSAVADRLLLALAYATSAQSLMLGVIPEAYGWAMAGVGLHMALLAHAQGRPLGARWPAALSALLNVGITVTNGGLNLVSSAWMAWRRMPLQRWVAGELRLWLPVLLVFVGLVGLMTWHYAPALFQQAGEAPRRVWWTINIQRGEAATLWEVVRALVGYNFVAPDLTVLALPAPDLHDMVDFRAPRFSLQGSVALTLWALAMALGAGLAWRDTVLRRLLAVAALWVLMTIVLHWFWQYRGSIWLYGAHISFVLFAVLAVGYGCALARWPRAWVRGVGALALVLSAWNNLVVYGSMVTFLLRQPLAS